MKAPQRLVWSEGMFVSPQHLQALDRFHEASLAARVAALAPCDWGVVEVELDRAALGAGQVRLQRFCGILPDGTPLAFGESDPAAPPARSPAEHFPATLRALPVHLGIPRERDGVPAYADESAGAARTRWITAARPVQDSTAPSGATVPVAFARPNTVLLFGEEMQEDCDRIQIAELVRSATGQLALSEGYVPPALRLGASQPLVSRLRELVTRVVAKQRELSDGRRQREGSPSDVTAADLARMLQLLALGGAIPLLSHLAETAEEATPRDAYLALTHLAGQLSAFSTELDPATFPRFAHADLRSTFDPLFAGLGAVLGGIALARYQSVPLEQRPGGLHLARIQDDAVLRSQLFLAVKSDLAEQQIAEQLPRLCKVASTAEIQGLVQAAAPGLPLQVVHRPPPELPLRQGTLYFSLATGDRYWQGILANRNIAIYLPPPFDPARTKLELLAIAAAADAAGMPRSGAARRG